MREKTQPLTSLGSFALAAEEETEEAIDDPCWVCACLNREFWRSPPRVCSPTHSTTCDCGAVQSFGCSHDVSEDPGLTHCGTEDRPTDLDRS